MPSLVDIAPSIATCKVRGVDIEVPGVSAQGLAYLFMRFEDLRKLFGGRGEDIKPETMMAQTPEIIGAFIAAGLGRFGDAKEEAIAQKLSAGDTLPLLEMIWKETFPRGYQDFIKALERVFDNVPASVASGWAPDTKSAEPSPAASSPDTHPPSPGDTHQSNSSDGSSSLTESNSPKTLEPSTS
jgi:hypothetical protein